MNKQTDKVDVFCIITNRFDIWYLCNLIYYIESLSEYKMV